MATARDLIQDAFELLGVYAPGEDINTVDGARGLTTLNKMMDSWSNESLTCYAILEQSFALLPGKQSYTIGLPGGSIPQARPIRILEDPGTCFIRDGANNDYPVEVVPRDKWNLIGLKTTQSQIPSVLFYDPQYPLGIINIFPIPSINWTLYFDSYLQMVRFANMTQAMSLPPGYEAAITSNLALWLDPYYLDAQVSPKVATMAGLTLGNIKRTNMRPVEARYDAEIVSRANATWNIWRDRSGV